MRFQDFFGGDKLDRTADLMTASCYRFVILSVFASNTSVPSAKSAGFCKVLSIASTRFHAHLGHNLGQGSWANSGGIPNGADMDCSLDFADSQVMKEKKSPHAQHSSPRFVTSKIQNTLCQKSKIKNIKNAKFILTMPSRYSIL